MRTNKIGLVTIGQAPRVDLVPEIRSILGNNIEIAEKGALDNLTLNEVKGLYPEKDDDMLVTRMKDGTEVKVSEQYIYPKIVDKIKEFENDGIKIILLACTGEFPEFSSDSLVIRPQKVLYNVVNALAQNSILGVIVPNKLQINAAKMRWSDSALKVVVEQGSPYGEIEGIKRAAEKLAMKNADMIVMDCIGYTLKMKEIVKEKTGRPVILARTITSRVIQELL